MHVDGAWFYHFTKLIAIDCLQKAGFCARVPAHNGTTTVMVFPLF